ncbi:hypothetical protein TWF106_007246 [Orbilia oligospora]|uniref:Large ribosomal subunit protein mL45 n=1 Tax=Orbilia oligospora TaxID=2813651 RepID=A0A6G1LVL1_ORBOL|nr:hypothetical protein TWF191_009763 [Orbilia oligospora]KAF3214591.1 hypothetical protein TWF191_009763 [Orbilia oligospora]KAF3219140.1 hypothetical protein TWF106_007246 [Orbilia oligospora]KAF3234533.1 hypothetical protein TWF192_001298 [Orbilia oligospora]KAF3234534.1 hypothetical protein TWF192_001298 [Orbilia oligospora]
MASLPPFGAAAGRILSHRPTIGIISTRPACLLILRPQTRSITDMERQNRQLNRSIARMDKLETPTASMRTNQSGMIEEVAELLLPSTFITPPFFSRPSIFTDTRNRIQFEWVRTKIKAQDLVSRYLARIWHSDPFLRKDIIPSAEALHRNMYTAFARGDVDALSRICGRDLYNTFRNRITSRPANVQFSWKFSGYNSRSRIMSHKVGMLGQGKGDENSIRQVVVRIDSTQALIKGVDGKVVKGTGEPTKTVEYIVLSKRRRGGVPEGPWVVWGTVTESGMDEIRAHGLPPQTGDSTVSGSGGRWSR